MNKDDRRYQQALVNIRETMAFFGCPVDDLTDEELERGIMVFSKAWAKCGVTVQEAIEGLCILNTSPVAEPSDPETITD
jgi:hypothetical protein